MSRSLPQLVPAPWRFALGGAVASLPLTVVVDWRPYSEASIAGGIMIFGAFIAGAVAAIRSAEPAAAGVRAGLLGGVIGLLGPIIAAAAPVVGYPGLVEVSPSRIVFFIGASAVVLLVAPLFGLVCGRIGGWLATTATARWTASSS